MRWRHRKAVPDGWRGVCAAEVRGGGAGHAGTDAWRGSAVAGGVASGPSGEGAGGQEAGTSLGGCVGPCLPCFKLEAMQTPHGRGHSEVPGIVGAPLWQFQGTAASLIKA